jgi:hypothetical protein
MMGYNRIGDLGRLADRRGLSHAQRYFHMPIGVKYLNLGFLDYYVIIDDER